MGRNFDLKYAEKVTFEQRPEGSGEVSHENNWKNSPWKGTSKCKGLVAGAKPGL